VCESVLGHNFNLLSLPIGKKEKVKKMFDPKNPRLEDVDLSSAVYLDSGSFGKVYRVYPGFVVKTGDVDQAEVDQQEYLASCGLAMPVLDFDGSAILTYEAESVGYIPDDYDEEDEENQLTQEDYWDFKNWIEDEWYNGFAQSHLDDHCGNWGIWRKEDGSSQFVWLDCDPDWSCDFRCEECNCALASWMSYETNKGYYYCAECYENLPKCEDCGCVCNDENELAGQILCSDCAVQCAECGFTYEEEEIDTDTRLCPDCLDEMIERHKCYNCGTGCIENGYPTLCQTCKKLQPLLPGFESAHLARFKLTPWYNIFKLG